MAAERKHAPRRARAPVRVPGSRGEAQSSLPPEGMSAGQLRIGPTLLRLGTQALERALSFATPADMVLRSFFREHPKLGRRDRGLIAETVFAVLRRLNGFTILAEGRSARRLFLLGARALNALNAPIDIALTEGDEAWLARVAHIDLRAAPFAVATEFPEWLIGELRQTRSDEEILALAQGMQSAAPLDLRVNTLRTTREQASAGLVEIGIEATPTPHSPLGLRVAGKPALERHALFQSGAVEVQDEGSQLLGYLLAPRRREMVVDFCAGAGGKTLHLGAMMRSEGRLYAFDVSPQRLQRLRARVARSGLSNVQVEVISGENDVRFKRLAGKIDRVLVDAPCTGFGTLRRNPDLKWRQQPADLEALVHKQRLILETAARLLKPGGRLVYATCSILPAENDAIADGFLKDHPDFVELNCEALLDQQGIGIACGPRLRLAPHLHATDGFFAAAFERRVSPEAEERTD